MMKNRTISGMIAVWMGLQTVFACFIPVQAADKNTINIATREDFERFANDCVTDSRSEGKTVNLTADIDFSGCDFNPIPIFGGTFNGNGYMLSGISYSGKGSYKGVFRYIEQSGKISDLHISASFDLNGSKSFLGGIVGENSGTIENCSFDGSLKGENVIGGIVGNNTDYGRIISCRVSGNITGENSTGGIVGKNSGFIQDCTNEASVNTVYEEKKNDISDLETDTASILESYKVSEEENREESLLGHTDTGGIAGYTSGIVQGCVNNGAVGYTHIGYNVGGIAGRQSGYILGCKNYGFIQGRKDTGGIVGQAEPYILLNASEGGLKEIRSELNRLNTMVNEFISDTDHSGDFAGKRMDEISKYTRAAQSSAESLINCGTDFIDDNLAQINAQAAIFSNTIDKLVPIFDRLENSGADLTDAIDKLGEAVDDLDLYAPDLTDEINDIADALSYIAKSERALRRASSKAQDALEALDAAVRIKNEEKVKEALADLSEAIADIASAKREIGNAVEEIEKMFSQRPEDFEEIGINAKKIAENLKIIKDNTEEIVSSLKTVNNSIGTLAEYTQISISDLKAATRSLKLSLGHLSDAMEYIMGGLDSLGNAMKNFSDEFKAYTDDVSGTINKTEEKLSDSLALLSRSTDSITKAISDMGDIISDTAEEEPLEFVKLGEDFRNASDGLFDSLLGISDEIDGLKKELSDERGKVTRDLTAVCNQFNSVMNLLTEELEGLKNGADSLKNIFVDVSDEDIEAVRQGKIADCLNCGGVESDRNTGGVVGNMSIEYSIDPEDDAEKPDTLNFTYRTRAIVYYCINEGPVKGKKDCVGGIVGMAEIGTVYGCENYGDAESTNGGYVGGVAGKSDSSIRKSYAKNKVKGKSYVGGIAGKGDTVTSSYTIVNVEGDECLGAVCGNAEDKNKLHNNFYVNNGLGALDGISYKEHCEEIGFEELSTVSGVPPRFISFKVEFVADGNVIEVQDIKYGDETKWIKYPEIPQKDGCFGKWKEIEAETVTENITVTCEYSPYITIISSSEKNESGKLALALAEGEFTDAAELHIAENKEKPPVKTDENVKVYGVSMTNTDIKADDEVTVRVLNENKDKVTAWRLNDGEWEKLNVSDKGKYVIMQLKGEQNIICLKYDGRRFGFVGITIVVLIAAVAAAGVFMWKFYIKRKK